jgi:hypothetical protein
MGESSFDSAQDKSFDPVQNTLSKDDAQERADQIEAFRAEVARLDAEGANPFTHEQLRLVARHHDALLERLAVEFDIDRSLAERRMSLGMRIASGFGAVTLTAALVSFIYQIWGSIPTAGQVVLLTLGPLLAIAAMVAAGTLERTRYIAAVMAVVACGAFVLQTVLLGQIFNLRGSPHSLLLWGLFALAVAYPWRFVLPFGLGVVSLVVYAAALLFWVAGVAWVAALERPEPLMLVAAIMLPLASRAPRELVVSGRAVLLVLILGPLLLLSGIADLSLLAWTPATVRGLYQVVAAVAAVVVIASGVRRSQDEIVLIGALFAGAFLLTRFVDWWWDWMPRYLFFLILATVALTWIWALRVLRRHAAVRAT